MRSIQSIAAVIAILLAGLALGACQIARAADPVALAPGPRRPMAAVLVDANKTLLVANRNGAVSVVDVEGWEVRGETKIGRRLVDLAGIPGGKLAIALDEESNEAILVAYDGAQLLVRARLNLPAQPAGVTIGRDGARAYVSLRWAREVIELDVTPNGLSLTRRTPLPFPPQMLLYLSDGKHLLVADAFGGNMAVINVERMALLRVVESDDHNFRGLALTPDGKSVAIAQQNLDPTAPTTADAIDGNRLINNQVRTIELADLLAPADKAPLRYDIFRLGFAGSGSADPAGMAFDRAGQLCVALAGTHEVALVNTTYGTIRRVDVGRRPTRLLLLPDGRLLVVNTFDDSLSIVDTKAAYCDATHSLGPPGETHPRDRGELLFYDGRLSRDGWMSCHSCHSDGHSNGRLADTLGDDSYGTPKRVLSLLATADTGPWGWNGGIRDIFDQVEKSTVSTMHGQPLTRAQSADIASFLYTLRSPPRRLPPLDTPADKKQLEQGRQLFTARGCVKCHVPPLTYTQLEAFDVGIADERGLRKFNPPSLVGVGQRERLFHDNRGESLEDLFERHGHQMNDPLTREELAALVRFLRSL